MFAVPGVTRKLDWKFKSSEESKESREETNGRQTRRNVNECMDQLCIPPASAWKRQDSDRRHFHLQLLMPLCFNSLAHPLQPMT